MDQKVLKLLEKSGIKKTKTRIHILELLLKQENLLSAQDIHVELTKTSKSVNLSSVYRTLDKLVEVKLVNQVNLENKKESLYEFNEHSHHHFLVCDDCEKVVIVRECPIDDYEKRLAESYGFEIEKHKIEFHGKCNECK